MPSAIVETATKGTPINAPVGADPRTAASVRTPLQTVGNRLKFLEDFYDFMVAFVTGGVVVLGGNLSLQGFRTTLTDLTVARGWLTGQSLRKPLVYAAGANPTSPILLAPNTYDTVLFRSGSLAADTEVHIVDSLDALPIGYSVTVKSHEGNTVSVLAPVAGVNTTLATMNDATYPFATVVKTATGPATWDLVERGAGPE